MSPDQALFLKNARKRAVGASTVYAHALLRGRTLRDCDPGRPQPNTCDKPDKQVRLSGES